MTREEIHENILENSDYYEATALLQSLRERSARLLAELKAFQKCLELNKKQKETEIRVFQKGVESEVKSIQTISKQYRSNGYDTSTDNHALDETTSKYMHALKSSNLPFYEAVWHTARKSQAVLALGKRMYWTKHNVQTHNPSACAKTEVKKPKASVVVDIVSNDGLEWTKVSTITEKRLLFEMAKEGWETYGGSESEASSQDENGLHRAEDSPHRLELVQVAHDLHHASCAQRIAFRHPKIQFVLPNIHEGHTPEIDAILADIRSTGATIMSGDDYTLHIVNSTLADLRIEPAPTDLTHLLPQLRIQPTQTINIDCTILLALISDISHVPRPKLPISPANRSGTYHTAILRQIEIEEVCPLLENDLYPLLNAKKLVCTNHAAQRMREIVKIMGTATELDRAAILFAEGQYATSSSQELSRCFQQTSHYPVPEDLQLPMQIFDFDGAESDLVETPNMKISIADFDIAHRIVKKWSTGPGIKTSLINKSVFMYGWYNNITTITSNRVVAAGLARMINDLLDKDEQNKINGNADINSDVIVESTPADDFIGPQIYVCDTARSLVGKEKQIKYDS